MRNLSISKPNFFQTVCFLAIMHILNHICHLSLQRLQPFWLVQSGSRYNKYAKQTCARVLAHCSYSHNFGHFVVCGSSSRAKALSPNVVDFQRTKKKEVWPRRSQSQRLPVHCLWFQKHVMGPSSCTLQAGNGSLWEHWEPTIIVNFNHPAPQGCDFQTFNIELGYSPCILPYFQIPNLIPIYFHLGLPKIFNRLSYMHPEAH